MSEDQAPTPEELTQAADEAVSLMRPVEDLFPRILDAVPRMKLVEHLRFGDRRAYVRYFKGFRPQKIPRKRIEAFMRGEVFDRENGVLAHLIIVLWNEVRDPVYQSCKAALQSVNPDVTKIEHVDATTSRLIITRLIDEHGLEDVAIVVAVNDARFDRAVLNELLPGRDWSRAPTAPAAEESTVPAS